MNVACVPFMFQSITIYILRGMNVQVHIDKKYPNNPAGR